MKDKNIEKRCSLSDLKKLARKRLKKSGSKNFPHCEPSSMAKVWNNEYVDIQDAIHQTIK